MSVGKKGSGIRTRILLLLSLVLVIAGTTAASMLIIRNRLQKQIAANLDTDLKHSLETFQDLEARRLTALERENALMADLPPLKALMTTSDPRTIADGAVEFWKTSGNDLFALADSDGRVLAACARDVASGDPLGRDLEANFAGASRHYLFSDGKLFEYSVRPLYFGSAATGTLLGYVISGYSIDHSFLSEVGRGAGADATFIAGNEVAASTLPQTRQVSLRDKVAKVGPQDAASLVVVGGERYLAIGRDLSDQATVPLRLVVMKSFDAADRAEREINRLVFLAGLLALCVGAGMMLVLSDMVTRPLESLAEGVRAFGSGNTQHSLPARGTQEVRYLSRVFAQMRDEIQKTNRALLESERLATIGSMASSVSHDLRHYLAAVYANAEFLASPDLPAAERAELFEEIRLAVYGTTDMLDSLLIFSRTGNAMQRVPATISAVVERAMTLVRKHPDAERVTLRMERDDAAETSCALDTKQMERAVYNLLLNACQSARENHDKREVRVSVIAEEKLVSVVITDNGAGVAEDIRESLFDPFVSQGRQKGAGLGLTLAFCVAQEHGGDVKLISSRPGETVFRLTVARHSAESVTPGKSPQAALVVR